MIAAFHGRAYTEEELAARCGTTDNGTTAPQLVQAAQTLGFRAALAEGDLSLLRIAVANNLPVTVYLRTRVLQSLYDFDGIHAVVVTDVTDDEIRFADPWTGTERACSTDLFIQAWSGVDNLAILVW